eukprot:PhM_4_TR11279/c0_g1_i1/m.87741
MHSLFVLLLCGLFVVAIVSPICCLATAHVETTPPSADDDECTKTELWRRFEKHLAQESTSVHALTTTSYRLISNIYAWGFREAEVAAIVTCVYKTRFDRPISSDDTRAVQFEQKIQNILPRHVRFLMDKLALDGTTLKEYVQHVSAGGSPDASKAVIDAALSEYGFQEVGMSSLASDVVSWVSSWEDHKIILDAIDDPQERTNKQAVLNKHFDYQQSRWMQFHRGIQSQLASSIIDDEVPLRELNTPLADVVRDVIAQEVVPYVLPFGAHLAVVGGQRAELIPFDLFEQFETRVIVDLSSRAARQSVEASTAVPVQYVEEDVTLRGTPLVNSVRRVIGEYTLDMERIPDILQFAGEAMRAVSLDDCNSPRNVVSLRKADVVVINLMMHSIEIPLVRVLQGYLHRVVGRGGSDVPSVINTSDSMEFLWRYAPDRSVMRKMLQVALMKNVLDALVPEGTSIDKNKFVVLIYANHSKEYPDAIFNDVLRGFGRDGPLARRQGTYHYKDKAEGGDEQADGDKPQQHTMDVVVDVFRVAGNGERPRFVIPGFEHIDPEIFEEAMRASGMMGTDKKAEGGQQLQADEL